MTEAQRILSEMKYSTLVPNIVTFNIFAATYVADSIFVEVTRKKTASSYRKK
jgi:mRNA deadenylase 3'-5' endonuclease subunit Ccr4